MNASTTISVRRGRAAQVEGREHRGGRGGEAALDVPGDVGLVFSDLPDERELRVEGFFPAPAVDEKEDDVPDLFGLAKQVVGQTRAGGRAGDQVLEGAGNVEE